MNNEKFDINCPHCGNELECETALLDEQVTCPYCNKNFIVRLPQGKLPGNKFRKKTSGEKSNSKKAYPWGRLYISLARILALLMIIAILCYIANLLLQPFSDRNEALKTLKIQKIPDLLKKQNNFQELYSKTAELVMTGNNSSAKFGFPDDLVSPPGFFNEKLLSEGDIRKSLNTLNLYDEKILRMSSVMKNYFSRQYNTIFNLVNSGNAINISFEKKTNSSGSIVMTFGQDADFYTNGDKKPDEDINIIRFFLDNLEQRRKINALEYQREINNIRSGVNFIDERLNSEQKKFVSGSANTSNRESSQEVSNSGQDRFRYEKTLLGNIILRLSRLFTPENKNYYGWQIAAESQKLRDALMDHLYRIETIDKKFKKALKATLVYSLAVLISGLFSAFLLLVIADYLQAHFDSAVSLKSIDSKIKNFILLPLLLLLFLTGCGDSPEEVLKKDASRLQILAVDALFAKKISENPHATVYHVPGEELALISGGIKKITEAAPFTGSTYYSAQHVSCSAVVSLSPVDEYDKAPYTHRARLQISAKYTVKRTDSEKNPDGTPGLVVHFLPNWNSSKINKAQWLDNKLNEIPNSEFNHAVVLHNIAKNKPYFFAEQETFTVCYNSSRKAWELENTNLPANTQRPPVYTEYQLEQIMNGYNFRRLVTTLNGTRTIFWFKSQDYEIADKILNQNLLPDNGIWKKRDVVLNTRDLAQKIKEWDDKSRVSLKDISILLDAIKENPEAENKNDAVRIVENALVSIFMRDNSNVSLAEVLKFIQKTPNMVVVDKKKMESICLRKINESEKRKFKGKLTLLSTAIKKFNFNDSVGGLSNTLSQFPEILENKNYAHALKRWKNIAFIYAEHAASIDLLYSLDGNCEGYTLLKTCLRCHGDGATKCRFCNGSGICAICNGTGTRTVEIRIVRGYHKAQKPCHKICKDCGGKKLVKCKACQDGKTLDRAALKNAFRIELHKLLKQIQKMQSEI